MLKAFNKIRLAYLDELEKDYVPPQEIRIFTHEDSLDDIIDFIEPLFGTEVEMAYFIGPSRYDNLGILLRPSDVRANPSHWLIKGKYKVTERNLPDDDTIVINDKDNSITNVSTFTVDKGLVLGVDMSRGIILRGFSFTVKKNLGVENA